MAGGKKKKRGPPAGGRRPESATDENWLDEVLDGAQNDDGAFGGFEVRRPTLDNRTKEEGKEWADHFERSYKKKFDERVEEIEESWEADSAMPDFTRLIRGFEVLKRGLIVFIRDLMFFGPAAALLLMMPAGALTLTHIGMALGACLLTVFGMIHMMVAITNEAMHRRSIERDEMEIDDFTYGQELAHSTGIMVEMLFPLLIVWGLEFCGLLMMGGGWMPAIDPDVIDAGTGVYLLGMLGSVIAMLGVIPYAVDKTIERS